MWKARTSERTRSEFSMRRAASMDICADMDSVDATVARLGGAPAGHGHG